MKGKSTDSHIVERMTGKFKKCFETGLDASLSLFLTSLKCSRKRSPSLLSVSPMYSILHRLQVVQ